MKNDPPSKWAATGYEPKGYRFFSATYQREMLFVIDGPWKDWIVFKHPDGQWVSLRKATESDISEIQRAAAQHTRN